jgi:transposase-like protein
MVSAAPNIPLTAAEYRSWWEDNTDVPYGFCWCTCGERTHISRQSATKYGYVRGEPRRYLPYHHKRVDLPEPNPSGLCMCGCGEKTRLAPQSHTADGLLKGKPMRYLPGHQVRGPRPYRRKIKDRDRAEICRRYTEGETTYALARAFGVSDATIGNVLAQEGTETRTGSEAHRSHRVLSDAQELEVIRRYQGGESAKTIAEDFNVSTQPVFNALDRRGIPRNYRGVYESAKRLGLRVLSAAQEAEACRRYEHGESVAAIADAMSVGVGAVDGALKRGNAEMRPPRSRGADRPRNGG